MAPHQATFPTQVVIRSDLTGSERQERQDKQLQKQPPPSLPPSTVPTAEDDGETHSLPLTQHSDKQPIEVDPIQTYAIDLSTACNAAIRASRFGEQPNPVGWQTGLETARLLIDERVPISTARSAIAGVIQRFKGDRPPMSLAYFLDAIRRAHAATGQRVLNAADPSVPEVRGGAPTLAGNTSMHLPIVDGQAERNAREARQHALYDAARQVATHAWGKDPANAAAYFDIVERANAACEGMMGRAVGVRMRDAQVILECAELCGFLKFEEWLAEHPEAT